MDEDVDPLNLFNVKGRCRNFTHTPSRRQSTPPAETVLPHLQPSNSTNHPLRHKPQEIVPVGSTTTVVSTHQPEERKHHSPSSQERILTLEEEERAALAKLNKELLVSMYKKDFQGNMNRNNSSSRASGSGSERAPADKSPSSSPKHLPFTSTARHFQPPPTIPCLTNTTTRYGSRRLKIADGIVPTNDGDMYRNPVYTTSSYQVEFTDPGKR